MRYLGLDLGTRTLGVAVSDLLGIIASGVETYHFKEEDYETALKHVGELIKQYDVSKIALGLPLHMNGDFGDSAKRSQDFADKIKNLYNVEVVLIDERWSTKQANASLLQADLSRKKRKQVIDKMAAVVILQTLLDMR